MSEPKRKGGRPRKYPDGKLSTTMNFRVRDGIQELLAAEANRSGRSISEVVEKIVWDSFHQPMLVDQLAERFTRQVVGLVKADLSRPKQPCELSREDCVCANGAIECKHAVPA